MGIYEKLKMIQTELKAPKGQYNSFGGYKYRSCEDILEAVKPLLNKYNATMTITDTVELIGTRFYIKAAAILTDAESGESVTNSAYAREEEVKKGMDGSQITGTASSYARKYALNGLFLIDDTKDTDTDAHALQTEQKDKKATVNQIKALKGLVQDIPAMLKYYKVDKIEDLTAAQASETIQRLKGEGR